MTLFDIVLFDFRIKSADLKIAQITQNRAAKKQNKTRKYSKFSNDVFEMVMDLRCSPSFDDHDKNPRKNWKS